MAYNTIVRRGTAMPDSDQAENNKLTKLVSKGWILSAFGAANATQISNTAIAVFVNGTLNRIVASGGTANAFTGTVATNTTGAYIATVAEGGTLATYFASGVASLGLIAYPTIPASQVAMTFILVCATATGFNGGTNSFGDAAYTVSLYNFVGPAGIALSTESWTDVPG